jgi:hypothetical protein
MTAERRQAEINWTCSTYVGFEVFTVVVMKCIIFWDVSLGSVLCCFGSVGGIYSLDLEGSM